jgi:hypothetical protein
MKTLINPDQNKCCNTELNKIHEIKPALFSSLGAGNWITRDDSSTNEKKSDKENLVCHHMERHILKIIEHKLLREYCKREEIGGSCTKLHNIELRNRHFQQTLLQ